MVFKLLNIKKTTIEGTIEIIRKKGNDSHSENIKFPTKYITIEIEIEYEAPNIKTFFKFVLFTFFTPEQLTHYLVPYLPSDSLIRFICISP